MLGWCSALRAYVWYQKPELSTSIEAQTSSDPVLNIEKASSLVKLLKSRSSEQENIRLYQRLHRLELKVADEILLFLLVYKAEFIIIQRTPSIEPTCVIIQ